MSQKISTLLADILHRAQLDPSDPKYASLLTIDGEISDDAHRDITGQLGALMTLDEARNHSDLHRHFRQQALNPVDTEIQRWIDDLDAPDDVKADILGQKNSYNRLRRALEASRALEAKKITTTADAEKQAIQQRIDDLTAQLTTVKQDAEIRVMKAEKESTQRLTDFALRHALGSKKYANDKFTTEQNADDARTLLDAHLRAKGATLGIDTASHSLRLMSASSSDAPYQESGKQIEFHDFLDSFLASKGILQINDPAPPLPSGTTFHSHIPAQGRIPASNARAIAEMEG